MNMPFTWSSRLVQVFVIFSSLASPSVSETTSSAGNRGRSSRFLNVVEERIPQPASRWLQVDRSWTNTPLEELRSANVDQPDARIASPSTHKRSPDTTGRSLGGRSLDVDSYHYYARELSERSFRGPPISDRRGARTGSSPPPSS